MQVIANSVQCVVVELVWLNVVVCKGSTVDPKWQAWSKSSFAGNVGFIEKDQSALTSILEDCLEPKPTTCNKQTGGKQRLQKWSRGLFFIVRGGGIIDKWSPLFKWVLWNRLRRIVLSYKIEIGWERESEK